MKKNLILLSFIIITNLSFAQDSTLINQVINQLNIDQSKIKKDSIITKVQPNNTKETIIVIPMIVAEDKDYIKLNGYILIVNNETGKILYKYFERSCWVSDGINYAQLEIDTSPYIIAENKQAFGIRIHYSNESEENPRRHSTISLYMKSKNRLRNILKKYPEMEYVGKWDSRCEGESNEYKKTLHLTTNKTNGHFDILIKNEITYTESHKDKNGECNAFEKLMSEETLLKFNGEGYTENGIFTPLEVYLDDLDEGKTNIRQSPNGKIILSLDETKDYYTLTITASKNGWFKVTKIEGVESDHIEIPKGDAWIHHSVIGISTRRKIELLDAPEEGNIVGTIEQETGVKIKDKYLDWVKIEYKGLTGWIESEWLCGNPVTTCP